MANLSQNTLEQLIAWFRHDTGHLIANIRVLARTFHRHEPMDKHGKELMARIDGAVDEVEFLLSAFTEIILDREMVPVRFSSELLAPVVDRRNRGNVTILPSIRNARAVLVKPKLARLALMLFFSMHDVEKLEADAILSGSKYQFTFRLVDPAGWGARTNPPEALIELLSAAGFEVVQFSSHICVLTAKLASEETNDSLYR